MATKVALLNEELEKNIARRETLKAKGDGMSAADRSEFQTLTDRGKAIVNLIEDEKQKAADLEFEAQKRYMDDPVNPISHPVNADDAGRKSIEAKGWELKSGMWHIPTSLGKSVAMYPEEALFGAIPDDDVASAQFMKQVRSIIQPEYRSAWLKWYRTAATQGPQMAMALLSGQEQKALSEGNDGAGGFAVPPDIQAEIGGRRAQTSVMRRLATVRSTMRDVWKQPMVKPNSSSRNIYADDFVAAWVGETPSQASIDVQFEMFEIAIKKVRAFTLISNDLIADSVGNLVADLAARGGRSLGLKEDEGFIAGGASALEPQGILSHPLALTATSSDGMAYDVEGTTSNSISNTSSDAGSAPKIKQLVYQLPSQYAANASWLMRRATQGKVAGLVDANGRPFWNSYLESGFARPQMIIEGFPVENSEFVGADGSVSAGPSTIPLIFGDISEYRIIERQQLSVRVLTERFGDTDQTGLFLFSRVGGGLWNYDAIRLGYIAS